MGVQPRFSSLDILNTGKSFRPRTGWSWSAFCGCNESLRAPIVVAARLPILSRRTVAKNNVAKRRRYVSVLAAGLYRRASKDTYGRYLPLVRTKLLETFDATQRTGRRVVVVSPTPGNRTDVGQCLIRALHFGEAKDNYHFTQYPGLENDARFRLMDAVAGDVGVMDLADMICPDRI